MTALSSACAELAAYRLLLSVALANAHEDQRTIARLTEQRDELRRELRQMRAFDSERRRTHLFMAWLCSRAVNAQELREAFARLSRERVNCE